MNDDADTDLLPPWFPWAILTIVAGIVAVSLSAVFYALAR